MADPVDDLAEDTACLDLGQNMPLFHEPQQVTALGVLHYHVNHEARLQNAVKPNDVGVAHHRQKANFCLHSRVLSKVKLFLVNYFDCDFLLRQLVDSKHDLAKCTFADFIL